MLRLPAALNLNPRESLKAPETVQVRTLHDLCWEIWGSAIFGGSYNLCKFQRFVGSWASAHSASHLCSGDKSSRLIGG